MRTLTGILVLGVLLLVGATPSHATPFTFEATLTGAAENPPNPSPGTGFVTVVLNDVANTLSISGTFQNLTGTTTDAHIHCCVAPPGNIGIATPPVPPGFPLGVTSGTFNLFFDTTFTTTYSSTFLNNFGGGTAAGAEAALLAGLLGGQAYFNIHTTEHPGGEIRGFLAQVPEPGTLGLLLLGLGALGLIGARRAL